MVEQTVRSPTATTRDVTRVSRHRLASVALTTLRIAVVAGLLAVPLAIATAVSTGLARGQYVRVFGRHFAGDMNHAELNYVIQDGEIIFDCITGWSGIPPVRGEIFSLPGLLVNRTVVTLTGATRGDVILSLRFRYWLLLVLSVPPLAFAYFVARPLWSRPRLGPGHCRHCGYDLRATTDRCPECGTVVLPPGPR